VLGARHLDELTRPQALDLFVLFSSATAAFGNPGQAAYVAANTWLEALAAHRRAQGLCATAVGWGPIADSGFLARNEKMRDALENRLGGSALKSELALDVLEEMLLADRSGLAALEFEWQALSRVLPSAGSPKFGELARECGGDDDDQSQDIRRLLAELPDDELLVVIGDMLRSEIGEILRIPPEKIDANRSLFDMGLDSLMGVELAVALDARFGIRLPVLALSQTPTISRLAERLLLQLRETEDGARGGAAAQEELLAQTELIARQQGVEVSDEEIARFAADFNTTRPSDDKSARDRRGA
jgi:phthiocerol/phenolphthiocerol synthesis type-I polyketide synthase C